MNCLHIFYILYKKKIELPFFLFFTLLSATCLAQKNSDTLPPFPKYKWLANAPAPNKARLWAINGVAGTTYLSVMTGLSQYWYKNYARTKFHFFNDLAEWKQIDKLGHTWTANMQANFCYPFYRWTGLNNSKAAVISGIIGFGFQSGIEVLDGFSAKWGASVGDITANFIGSTLFTAQQLAWEEQRIQIKFSSHSVNYQQFDNNIQQKVKSLYGTSFYEKLLKDYNGQSYWLSFNIKKFLKNSKTPPWLNVAVGYSAEQMFGGRNNKWIDENTQITYNYEYIPQLRQYYLSLDVDLSKINTGSYFFNKVLKAINVLKFPAPALEINNKGAIKGYWLYY